jgi:hypothetical protein
MAKRKLSKRLERQAAAYQKLNLRKLDASEWDDELHRCIVANQVLQISGSQNALVNDASFKAAFDAFALNPANPRHWKMLLHIFASEHFRTAPTKRKRGAGVNGQSNGRRCSLVTIGNWNNGARETARNGAATSMQPM